MVEQIVLLYKLFSSFEIMGAIKDVNLNFKLKFLSF